MMSREDRLLQERIRKEREHKDRLCEFAFAKKLALTMAGSGVCQGYKIADEALDAARRIYAKKPQWAD